MREEDDGRKLAVRVCRTLLRLAAVLAPAARRSAFLEEWESEVWHATSQPAARAARTGTLRLAIRCLGAIPHALSMRAAEVDGMSALREAGYAIRSLGRQPVFAVTTVTTLALGIGGTTALFSLVNGVLLRPLPYADPGQLVWMWGSFSRTQTASVSPPDYLDYAAQTRSFSAIAAMSFSSTALLGGPGGPEEAISRRVTANFLEVMGIEPRIGRAFTESETAVAESQLVILSESLWRRRYGADAGILGREILIDGRAQTVIGVLPQARAFPEGTDIWRPLPLANEDYAMRAAHFLRPIGRLRDGVTIAQAQEDMDIIARRLESAYPQSNTTWRLRLVPLQTALVGDYRVPLLTLLGAVMLVLLIGCANVAGLQLARASSRRGEVAVRSALGASRLRVFRQLMIESIVVALAAGVAGILVAYGMLTALTRAVAIEVPRLAEVTLDGPVLLVAIALSAGTGILFGLVPAWQLSGERLSGVLRATARDPGSGNVRGIMVIAEIGLAVVLLASASLLIRSFDGLRSEPTGFDVQHGLVARVVFPAGRYPDAGAVNRTTDALLDRLRSLPGIESAGAINALPMVEFAGDTRLYAASRPPADPNEWRGAQIRVVTDGYFEAMGIPLLRGRLSSRADRPGTSRIVLVNEALARELFGDDDPIGEVLMIGLVEPAPMVVAGVVGSVRQVSFGQPPIPEFYIVQNQELFAVPGMTIVMRTGGEPENRVAEVREAIHAVDPDQPLSMLQPLDVAIAGTLANLRFRTTMLTLFAALALLLCSVGIYGILAFIVTRRTREIGIRLALGANAPSVITAVIGRGLVLTLAGLALGLAGSLGAARLLSGMLYGVGPGDPASFAVSALAILVVALLASAIPAARAASVDPARALRAQ